MFNPGRHKPIPPQPRRERTPISCALLIRLLLPEATADEAPIETLALNASFTLAFTTFLRMREFTYLTTALIDRNRFRTMHLTVPRVSLGPDHVVITLPRSKTDVENRGVTIRIARTWDEACVGTHMEKWLQGRPPTEWPPLLTPLFVLSADAPFTLKL